MVIDTSAAARFTTEQVFTFITLSLEIKATLILKFFFSHQLVTLLSAPIPQTPIYSDEAKDDLEVHLFVFGLFNQILLLSLLF